MNKDPMVETFRARVSQSGGKYGTFACPSCGGTAQYKFTGGSGWCDPCGRMWCAKGAALHEAPSPPQSPHWIEMWDCG